MSQCTLDLPAVEMVARCKHNCYNLEVCGYGRMQFEAVVDHPPITAAEKYKEKRLVMQFSFYKTPFEAFKPSEGAPC